MSEKENKWPGFPFCQCLRNQLRKGAGHSVRGNDLMSNIARDIRELMEENDAREGYTQRGETK